MLIKSFSFKSLYSVCVWWWSLACGVAAVLARNNNNNSHHYYIIKFIRHAWPFCKKKERATARCCHKNERRSRREGLILFLSHLAQACQIWTEEELSNREASRSLPCCCCCCVVVVSGWNAFFFLLCAILCRCGCAAASSSLSNNDIIHCLLLESDAVCNTEL